MLRLWTLQARLSASDVAFVMPVSSALSWTLWSRTVGLITLSSVLLIVGLTGVVGVFGETVSEQPGESIARMKLVQ